MVTRGYAEPDGSTVFGDIGLSRLTDAGLAWRVLDDEVEELRADQLEGADAVLVLGPERVSAASIPESGRLRHVARFGAGFDAVDTDACARRGVLVTNTPEAVRRPVADSVIALLYALSHNLVVKDRLVREGRWAERREWRGPGLAGATVGIVGLGGIGLETARRVRAQGLRVLGYNRGDRRREATEIGIELRALDEVLATSDYVVVAVAANPRTRHLIGERELALMRPAARLINVSRGVVVDEEALATRLSDGRLAGAGLDVFTEEPLRTDSPLTALENVVLAPHSLCWTDQYTAAVSASVVASLIAVSRGERPVETVNGPFPDGTRPHRNEVDDEKDRT
ncbi:NAD(P)-dependent oxidoreductase [Streptomyces rugosispiralis]|uniref:NAD(P)-binding domain-containing protein n=1 Tax=Streptomyces rugosispiralis TaxID=2967341 RepID=A0ABT1URA1_9ACTN|nr:NAD(P)-dependent oxidoreductase [Streptomyces rugosispiralis]MCQ8187646.1 NAD(P)-binding domain-containing protein [Streptomyces rugosispiralis]